MEIGNPSEKYNYRLLTWFTCQKIHPFTIATIKIWIFDNWTHFASIRNPFVYPFLKYERTNLNWLDLWWIENSSSLRQFNMSRCRHGLQIVLKIEQPIRKARKTTIIVRMECLDLSCISEIYQHRSFTIVRLRTGKRISKIHNMW